MCPADQAPANAPLIEVDPSPCTFAWKGCEETYTGGHYCEKKARHQGDHVCVCKARSKR